MANPFKLNDFDAKVWMKILLDRAREVGLEGEVPVAAIILDKNGLCISRGENRRERDKNPLAHAEIIAIQNALKKKKDWRFNDCTMLVTLEPCPMCAGAIIQARMGQLIFGASDIKRGAFGGVIDLSKDKTAHHKMIVKKGIMAKTSQELLQNWFRNHRK